MIDFIYFSFIMTCIAYLVSMVIVWKNEMLYTFLCALWLPMVIKRVTLLWYFIRVFLVDWFILRGGRHAIKALSDQIQSWPVEKLTTNHLRGQKTLTTTDEVRLSRGSRVFCYCKWKFYRISSTIKWSQSWHPQCW